MLLSDEMRALLLDGPTPGNRDLLRYGGAATVRVAWGKHRDELMAALPLGRRPYGFWMIEKRLKQRPAGELGELRAIRTLGLYRSDAERRYVLKRIGEIMETMHARRHQLRAVA